MSSTLLRDINDGELSDVPAQFYRWVHINGVVDQGLVNRRAAEVAIWNTPDT
jgi:GH24 family phage-related lysozyme (muramidase)